MIEEFKQWITTNPQVGAAVVAGLTSLIVAILIQPLIQWWLENRKGKIQTDTDEKRQKLQQQIQQELEELKSRMDERRSAETARRDYEYEARKRLYAEIEPIRFQVCEALEEAHYRVRSLARTARSGNLGIGADSWVANPGYYLRSTIYKLILPVTYFRLMQRRMTFIDLHLDPNIAMQYSLLKLYARSFTDDFIFAALEPKLKYEPNHPQSKYLREENPAVFSRQALVLGDLECVADLLTVQENGQIRVLQFGEFEKLFDTEKLDDNLHEILSLFVTFSPDRKPVLARLLLTQAFFAQLILSTYYTTVCPPELAGLLNTISMDEELITTLSWYEGKCADLSVIKPYLSTRLGWLQNNAMIALKS
ncbi:hypothetical protein [Methylomonas methanica]|uniref:Uncharacterized protein n=1 Tax=Methylomonas methanica (strain DSM 25384 / MC09) TaxID=857087 RepID=F9ZW45_METMM|nr:hypothetical protein [Methylomonas methanica]AEG02016.1 hypothetical protein Metme_3655 [Methylomonas methanica MC09]